MVEQPNNNLPQKPVTPLTEEQPTEAHQSEDQFFLEEVKEEIRSVSQEREATSVWLIKSVAKAGMFLACGILLIVLVGVAQRFGWISAGGGGGGEHTHAASADSNTMYICPMICVPPSPLPGRCPTCGMELVAATNSGGGDGLSVEFSPSARRVANIQTAAVKSMTVERSIRTVGKIAIDESRKATISAYVDGRIEKLFADYTGVDVEKGDHMVILYSPGLYAAQVEYLVTLESSKRNQSSTIATGMNMSLLENTKEKLKELGMSEQQIRQLEKNQKAETRLRVCAPAGGTVIKKMKDEGDYVKEGTPIYQIVDLSVVWLMLELFPSDAAQIRYGQKVEVIVQSLPAEVFTGRVAFIDPVVSEKTRTVNVRIEMLNSDRRLRPGDYATATVKIPMSSQGEVFDAELAGKWISPRHPQIVRNEPGRCPLCEIDLIPTSDLGYAKTASGNHVALVVPRNAILMAGDHSVVYVETEPGHFEIRPVSLGALTEKNAVILSGLKKGEQVATKGNFLIDSQMQLAGNPSLIDPTRAIEEFKKRNIPQPPSSGPLQLGDYSLATINGEAGDKLDQLYTAYLIIQKALAEDKVPQKKEFETIRKMVVSLKKIDSLPSETEPHFEAILKNSEEIDKLDIKQSRKRFKPISHAIIHLAVQIRGPKSSKSMTHYYCPMVKDGGGDWLQANGKLANPYFGSSMLRCGKKVTEYSMNGKHSQSDTKQELIKKTVFSGSNNKQ